VLTGDTLFVGDVGRPDLMASVGTTAEVLAKSLFASISKLASLPNGTKVYPAHGAGSMCGKKLGKETFSTIGREKIGNYAMNMTDEQAFVLAVTADQPDAPAYFSHDAAFNKREHDTTSHDSTPLTIEEVIRGISEGALLVDVREVTSFAGAHIISAINVGLRGQFAMWAGAVIDPSREIIIIAEPTMEDEALTRLRRIGFDRVRGFLKGGMTALLEHPTLVTSSRRVDVEELRAWQKRSQPPVIVDVRRQDEYDTGHIAESINIPLQVLRKSLLQLPRDRDVVVHCAGGYRSAIAASVLAAEGFQVADLIGGYGAWVQAGA
jgi:rhodanese-related sulfurtransferase